MTTSLANLDAVTTQSRKVYLAVATPPVHKAPVGGPSVTPVTPIKLATWANGGPMCDVITIGCTYVRMLQAAPATMFGMQKKASVH
jgi:hypothetical protein